MQIHAALVPYLQPFDHFGDVSMKVYDLAAAWKRFRKMRERHFLWEGDGVWTYRRHLNRTLTVACEALTAPQLKQEWMANMKAVTVESPGGRLGVGSDDHCAHESADFFYSVTDWDPFDYFSTRIGNPARPGTVMPETYQLTASGNGTDLRYSMGQAHDAHNNQSEISEQKASGFLAQFWDDCFDIMDKTVKLDS
jgi:hypothetical protein